LLKNQSEALAIWGAGEGEFVEVGGFRVRWEWEAGALDAREDLAGVLVRRGLGGLGVNTDDRRWGQKAHVGHRVSGRRWATVLRNSGPRRDGVRFE